MAISDEEDIRNLTELKTKCFGDLTEEEKTLVWLFNLSKNLN